MNTKIALKDIEFFAYHGFYDAEREMGHTFLVDIEVIIDRKPTCSEDISDTVNYEALYSLCHDSMNRPRKLIETVADEMVDSIKEKYPHIKKGLVSIRKKSPQLGGKVGYAMIEVTF